MRFLLVLLVLASAPASAQSIRLGDVGAGGDTSFNSGVTLLVSPRDNYDVTYLRWGPNADSPALVSVDGRRVSLRSTGRSTTRTARDAGGLLRTYDVSTFRSRDRAVEVELWLRDDDDGGGDCIQQRGGMTVRAGGRVWNEHVVASACQF